jgi:hypothetical protein
MDIQSVVIDQLHNASGLYSLMLQNHIYGCFIIIEDIAQKKFELNGTILSTPTFTFDCDKQFSEIGIRYGFTMDTKLELTTFHPEYKEIWLRYFKDIDFSRDIDEVDKIEDTLIEIIKQSVTPEDAYFSNALELGRLPQEWIEKVLLLLQPCKTSEQSEQSEQSEIEEKTAISLAITEKPIKKHRITRRTKMIHVPKIKTRRNR